MPTFLGQANIIIDQATLVVPGIAGKSRDDGVLGQLVTLRNADGTNITKYQWVLLRPRGSAAVLSSPASPTCQFTPDIEGSYGVLLLVNQGQGKLQRQSRIFAVRTAGGLRYPHQGESNEANWTSQYTGDPNETGWWEDLIDLLKAVGVGVNGSVVTVVPEVGLPASRQIVAGNGIFINDLGPGSQLEIRSTSGVIRYADVVGEAENLVSSRGTKPATRDATKYGQLNLASQTNGTYGTKDNYATVLGGLDNLASAEGSTIAGGLRNRATDVYAFVGGGGLNFAVGQYAAIAGGQNNEIAADNCFIGGGDSNIINDAASTIGGGQSNIIDTQYSAIPGGFGNTITAGNYAFIGGGNSNTSDSLQSVICGGYNHTIAGGDNSVIVGGYQHTLSALYSAIGGGYVNTISTGNYSVIAGGFTNSTAAIYSAIVGGAGNVISAGNNGFIGGGYENEVTAGYASVVGGYQNSADGVYACVLGGIDCHAIDPWTAVVGGHLNNAQGSYSVVCGGELNNTGGGGATGILAGYNNLTSGSYGVVCGGNENYAGHDNAAVIGGHLNQAIGPDCFVAGGANNIASNTSCGIVGSDNTAQGNYSYAFGRSCFAGHDNTIAIGRSASPIHVGSHVYKDGTATTIQSAADNELTLYYSGGIRQLFTASRLRKSGYSGSNNYVDEVHGSVSTTNATPATATIITIPSGQDCTIRGVLKGKRSGTADARSLVYEATYTNNGGTVALVGAAVVNSAQTAGVGNTWATAVNINGATLEIAITGAAAQTIRWTWAFECAIGGAT